MTEVKKVAFSAKTRGGKFTITATEDDRGLYEVEETISGKSVARSVNVPRDRITLKLARSVVGALAFHDRRFKITEDSLGVQTLISESKTND